MVIIVYIYELNQPHHTPWPIHPRLEGIEKYGNAMFSLSKFGKKVDTTLGVEGTDSPLLIMRTAILEWNSNS